MNLYDRIAMVGAFTAMVCGLTILAGIAAEIWVSVAHALHWL